jgi:hypothetical protein
LQDRNLRSNVVAPHSAHDVGKPANSQFEIRKCVRGEQFDFDLLRGSANHAKTTNAAGAFDLMDQRLKRLQVSISR